ncbi:Membrane protein insertase MisCB precursor [Corynebacterium urogenitale]|uniref:Membrane protein insertase YidC n=2 Tax=Corynebacterium urogenitale TaxID=2487892 RepID=A0A5J6Z3D3_9CORY|nr:Membrane protein insertase MisCB precursor [Corynebacterium urogenitale]
MAHRERRNEADAAIATMPVVISPLRWLRAPPLSILNLMIIVEYPVALVLKAWHLLFHNVFGMDASQAWLFCIPLLVLTVRALLLPVAYRQYHSTRVLANLRPHLREITNEYKDKKDRQSQREARLKRLELQKNAEYKMRDGCLPMLIQIPIFIGLYRLLLHISNPAEGLTSTHAGRGPLSSADIDAFLEARFFHVPLPAYYAMDDAQRAFLNITQPEILRVALPLIIFASICTTANFAYSIRRSMRTMDYSQAISHFFMRLLFLMAPLVMLFPWIFGLAGPAPLAILIYWVCNNLWTAVQAVSIQRYLDKKMPYTEAFREDWAAQKQAYKSRKGPGKHAAQRGKKHSGQNVAEFVASPTREHADKQARSSGPRHAKK